jgi:hypothetical protein
MSDEPGRDPRIRRVLTRGLPAEAPEGLLDKVALRTLQVAQRPTRPMTRLLGSGPVRLALAGVALAAVATFAVLQFVPAAPRPPVASSPADSAVPRPSIAADGSCDDESECLGLVPAGSASSKIFQPPFSFTAPRGWMNRDNRGGIFELRPIDAPGDVIGVYRDPVPMQEGRTVTSVPETARALIDVLHQDPELTVGSVQAATIGGISGWSADVSVTSAQAQRSSHCPGITCVAIFTATDPAPRPVWQYYLAVPGGSRARIFLLDAPRGVVLIEVLAWDGATFEKATAAAAPILASLRFATR